VTPSVIARAWFAVTAVVVLTGIVVQLFVTAGVEDGHFRSLEGRLFNVFCFFTIQSNIILSVTSALLALRQDRRSLLFRVLRLDGVLCIAVTFMVFHVLLADLHELHGGAAVADFLLHTASPVLGVAGWLLFGPHGLVSRQVVAYALVFPLAWLAFTLVRGPIVDFYPYPFVDVPALGYVRALLNCVGVLALFLLLAAATAALDRVLLRRALLSRPR
jgi:hypothetical protein